MRTSLLVLLLVGAAAFYVVATPAAAVGGEWQPIPNVADPHVQGLGQCAVVEHNKRANCVLKFAKVVSGKVHGRTYLLDVEAVRIDGSHKIYNVEVVDQISSGSSACNLVSFGAQGEGC